MMPTGEATCDRCGQPEGEGPGAFQVLWHGGSAHLDCREPEEVPDYRCAGCDDVVTEAGTREVAAQFRGADDLTYQDPPVEVGWHDEVGQVERCEVCAEPCDGRWWPGIPPHPGA